jgi:hypothetical protein
VSVDINPQPSSFAAAVKDTLRSPGWRMMFMDSFAPLLRQWKQDLLWNADLDELDRRGIQKALVALTQGFVEAYSKAGLTMPDWLRKELSPHDVDA